jgi:carbon-monoxide dehydrogenase small subunit
MTRIGLTVNGKPVSAEVAPRTHLADFLREQLLLTGTHTGCEHGICGACTVEIDGEIARSCITYAVTCDGARVRTIEGFDDDPLMARLRMAFSASHALQCGYCTPGMLIAARDLVRRKQGLSRAQIRREMSGNLCRCTGYMGIVSAIEQVMADPVAPADAALPPPAGWLGPPPGPRPRESSETAAGATGRRRAEPIPMTRSAGTSARPTPLRSIDVTVSEIEERDGLTRLSQRFVLDHPGDAVWSLVSDIERLARCMPGLTLDGPPNNGAVSGHLDVKVGPITARFAGRGTVQADRAERHLRVDGRGTDRKGGSNVAGSVDCRIVPEKGGPASTAVQLDLAYALTGPLAQIGRSGLVRDLARRIGEAFAQNMDAQLRDPGGKLATAPLAGVSLIWQIIAGRVSALLSKMLGRGR